MDLEALISYLTEGLDADQSKAVRDALKNEKVSSKVGGLRQQRELDELQQREATLKAELEGDGAQKLGAKAYKEWYDKNYAAVVKLQQDQAKYIEKYGTLEAPKPQDQQQQQQQQNLQGLTPEQVQQLVDKRIQEGYAPRWSDLLTSTGSIVQKHMFSGRKAPIDFKKLSEIAQNFGGDLDRAYDEYDKPEREKAAKEAQDKEIERRVSEELQKRGATQHFPAGADASPGILSRDRDTSKFDKAAMERDLVSTFIRGTDGKETTGSEKGFFN